MDPSASPGVRSRIALGGSSSQKNSRMSVRASHAFLGRQKGPEVHVSVLDNEGNDVTPQSLFGPAKVQGKLATVGVIQLNLGIREVLAARAHVVVVADLGEGHQGCRIKI